MVFRNLHNAIAIFAGENRDSKVMKSVQSNIMEFEQVNFFGKGIQQNQEKEEIIQKKSIFGKSVKISADDISKEMATDIATNDIVITENKSIEKVVHTFTRKVSENGETEPENRKNNRHLPIMKKEIIEAMRIKDGGCYIDATFGGGGHTRAILEKKGIVFALDRDLNAFQHAQPLISEFQDRFFIEHTSFAEIENIWSRQINPIKVDGILFDLGFSSNQIEDASRGFAFSKDGPLDMRFDELGDGITAQKWINTAHEQEMIQVFFEYGQEKNAKKIAKEIIKYRKRKPITTTFELVKIIEEFNKFEAKHAATRIFQAIRIHINDEFSHIQRALYSSKKILRQHGVLAVITFHSLEDKIVKDFFENEVNFMRVPTAEEIQQNPRARSAKLRWMIKTEQV